MRPENFLPDLTGFIRSVNQLTRENIFNDQEVFRLRKLVNKARATLLEDDDINIGTININRARSATKRASLVKLFELKKLYVQETHSDNRNERDWRREWPGQVFLSHRLSSSGVGIVFSRRFCPGKQKSHGASYYLVCSAQEHH